MPIGRLGNQMFQYLVARVLQSHAPDAVIVGHRIAEFGQVDESDVARETEAGAHIITIKGHVFPIREVIRLLRQRSNVEVQIRWPPMRMEYLRGYRALARDLFPIAPHLGTGFDDRHLVMCIRAGEILRGVHPNYTVLPIAWYRHLIEVTGLDPVFIGQIDDDPYSQALRGAFPRAQFVCHADPLEDFNRMRTSANVVLGVSSFIWLAGWLSTTARRIILPIIGMYHPYDRPDIDMLPVHDPRYTFHEFARETFTGAPAEIDAKIHGMPGFRQIRVPLLYRAKIALSLPRMPGPIPRASVWRDLREVLPPLVRES